MRNFLTLSVFSIIAISGFSQDPITGTLPNWQGGSGQVAVMSMGPPEVVGSFDADGHFQIPLKADYLEEVRQRMEAANSGNTNGWTAKLNTLEGRFSCMGGTLEMTNADQPMTGFPSMGAFLLAEVEAEKVLGYLMFGSSEDFARSLTPNKFQPGYFLEWYYVEEDASIKGECSIKSFAMNQEENYQHRTLYDLDFKAGWNIVKYEIEEVFTDKEGNAYPEVERYVTLPGLPEEVQFLYLTE